MAKRVFFSFHYQDVIDFRANVVRNAWLTKDRTDAGFFDASIWEEAKRTSTLALKRLINKALKNTSTTVVLIGTETYNRPWVQYEIFKSIFEGKNIFGVHINKIKGKDREIKNYGPNPFEYLAFRYSLDGTLVTPMVLNGKKWQEYSYLDGWSINKANVKFQGKIVRLSKWYGTYCWIKNDGFNNFASWVS